MRIFHARAPVKPSPSEAEIQRALFLHIRLRGALGLVAFHPKSGGIHQRGRRAAINTGLGVTPGISDVIIVMPPEGRVCALELKVGGRKATPEQLAFQEAVRAAGGVAAVVEGLDAALAFLEANGLLRGRST